MRPRLLILFFLSAIVVLLGMVVFFRQSDFLEKYDALYWKDRFEHSQWTLPLSKRTIGDEGIYAYGGYQLMNGASIEETNANKPPVGIYLIGLSILFFNNPNYFALITGVLSLIVFYFLAREFIKSKVMVVFAVALLALNPMFFAHLSIPLIDVLQMLFLMTQVLFFIYIFRKKERALLWAFASGLALGLFTETKPALILPLICALEGGYLLYRRKFKEIVAMGTGFGFGVIVPYFQYFKNGHGILDYIRLHKYMASVYYTAQNEVYRFGMLQAIFIGKFPDVSNGILVKFVEWSFMLPILFIGGVVSIICSIRNKKQSVILKGIGIFILLTVIVYSNISSYPRYLLAVLPFVIIFFVLFLTNFLKPKMLSIVCSFLVILGLINAFVFLIPRPDANLERFYNNFSNQMFVDVYHEDIFRPETLPYTALELNTTYKLALDSATIRHIKIAEKGKDYSSWKGEGKVNVEVTYFTANLGSFTENKTVFLRKDHEDWKVVWDSNIVLNQYKPGYLFKENIISGRRGALINKNGDILAQDQDGYLLSIDPTKIDQNSEDFMLKEIKQLTDINAVDVHSNYTDNYVPGIIVPIATNYHEWSEKDRATLASYPAIILTDSPVRVYSGIDSNSISNTAFYECCTRVYSSHYYHGVDGLEKQHDATLSGHAGGSLIMKDMVGNTVRVLIEREEKNGQDVVVD